MHALVRPRRAAALALALAAALPGLAAAQSDPAEGGGDAAPAEHVVLVSIDGLRPEFYLERSWPAPTLQQLAAEGVRVEAVEPVFPSVTYPNHTTMVTGALPARHGIYYNAPFEPGGRTGRWYWEAEHIRAPTLWDAVGAAGRKSAAVSWPVSVGAPIDWNVAEVWSLDRSAHPLEATREHARPEGLIGELEREATGALGADRFSMRWIGRDLRAGEMGAYLLEEKRPALLAVHFVAVDHFMHEAGREGHAVRRAVGSVDAALSLLVEAAERAGVLERTAFVVTGDHGFVDIHSALAPNTWLVAAGLRTAAADRGEAWRATFHTSGAAAFLHLRDADDAEAAALAREAVEALPGPVRRLFRVLDREDLDAWGAAAPGVPFALAPRPGYAFTRRAAGPSLQPTGGGTHGYLPDFPAIQTGLVAWGAGLRRGQTVPELRLTAVAPLCAELLGVELEAADGVAPPGLLDR